MPAGEKSAREIRGVARRYFEESAVRERAARVSLEQNKEIARRYFEDVWNKRNPAAVANIVSPLFVGHAPDAEIRGADALRQWVTARLPQYPDLRFTLEDMIGEGDNVCVRWTCLFTADGKDVSTAGMHLFRITEGKIIEIWVFSL